MKRIFFAVALLFSVTTCWSKNNVSDNGQFTISNNRMSVTVTKQGMLKELINVGTGQNYASEDYMWRLYYDSPEQKEIEITGDKQEVSVSKTTNGILLDYPQLRGPFGVLKAHLQLTRTLEEDKVRFSSKMTNGAEHTVIRELQYPLVRNIQLPGNYKLITAQAGGKIYDDVRQHIITNGFMDKPYKRPDQVFHQLNLKYPSGVSMNCFLLAGEKQGIYFGSHDNLFQDTWHGLRLYRDKDRKYTVLESGLYKYPNCFSGETWSNNANVIAPYSGTWHTAAQIYRKWAETWFDHRKTPEWVKLMPSWQRIIFKHQYGEYLFHYPDLYGVMKEAGHSVGCNAVLAFGWWEEGMDHGNPDYSPDRSQGGDEGWAAAIKEFKKDGDKLLMYYNGKLIDRESKFYKYGEGKHVCYHDNTGAERIEQYRFTNYGTWLGEYDARSFVVANTTHPAWRQKLIEMADRAYRCGANSVFYDQLGYGESMNTDWDLTKEYPVPNLRVLYDKGQTLKYIRAHIQKLDPDFALGTEWLCDYTAQYCDYIHMYPENSGYDSFQELFRYTFPEIIFTDRGLRDDTDVERRVNLNILKGIRNDIEIYRCRDLITDTPTYQAYLAKVNAIKNKYARVLLAGRFNDIFGFSVSSPEVKAKSFLSDNQMAIVMTNDLKDSKQITATIEVPGYHFKESATTGKAKVAADGKKVVLGKYDLAVLIYEKN